MFALVLYTCGLGYTWPQTSKGPVIGGQSDLTHELSIRSFECGMTGSTLRRCPWAKI